MKGGQKTLKGVARRVVILHPKDSQVFEEAIFIVREDYVRSGGVSCEEVLRQARRAAGDYLRSAAPEPAAPERWKRWLFIGTAGAALLLALIIIL